VWDTVFGFLFLFFFEGCDALAFINFNIGLVSLSISWQWGFFLENGNQKR